MTSDLNQTLERMRQERGETDILRVSRLEPAATANVRQMRGVVYEYTAAYYLTIRSARHGDLGTDTIYVTATINADTCTVVVTSTQ